MRDLAPPAAARSLVGDDGADGVLGEVSLKVREVRLVVEGYGGIDVEVLAHARLLRPARRRVEDPQASRSAGRGSGVPLREHAGDPIAGGEVAGGNGLDELREADQRGAGEDVVEVGDLADELFPRRGLAVGSPHHKQELGVPALQQMGERERHHVLLERRGQPDHPRLVQVMSVDHRLKERAGAGSLLQ